jgi:hypothetical protein
MLLQNREATRQIVNRPAKFQESPAAPLRRCTIKDISSTGVKLLVPGGLECVHFTLFDGGGEHRCAVMWRLGEIVGARFE